MVFVGVAVNVLVGVAVDVYVGVGAPGAQSEHEPLEAQLLPQSYTITSAAGDS